MIDSSGHSSPPVPHQLVVAHGSGLSLLLRLAHITLPTAPYTGSFRGNIPKFLLLPGRVYAASAASHLGAPLGSDWGLFPLSAWPIKLSVLKELVLGSVQVFSFGPQCRNHYFINWLPSQNCPHTSR
ncbi:hypothetical protein AAFF_G00117440 [Aldrovandia affinis]|uniref:Uncharacterized protein n=1 Tax=Aldrovandia affinis TaxID=143900 RepID=A0AAD7T1S3_9TELE|nr:hypothetical protein AAFF_G00117440 [Aldrovandia affinis]